MPVRRTTPETQKKAIELRHKSTPAEIKLWGYLRADQINGRKFRRQHAIGPFITDFCCVKQKLVIELDGGQHLEQAEYDSARTKYLQSRGYRVLRFGIMTWKTILKGCNHFYPAGVDPPPLNYPSLFAPVLLSRKRSEWDPTDRMTPPTLPKCLLAFGEGREGQFMLFLRSCRGFHPSVRSGLIIPEA